MVKNKLMKLFFLGLTLIIPFALVTAQPLGAHNPRVYLAGYGGSALMGKADLLVPTYLSDSSNLFIYGQTKGAYENHKYDDLVWTGSAGLGFRHVAGDTAMLGIYCLADYTNLATDKNFWTVSPGIEAVGKAWEFRANGYIPLSDKDWNTQGFADTFGDYSQTSFNGHDQYDHWYIYHKEIGVGADAEVGRKIAKLDGILFKAFINGYYFNMKDEDDVVGGGIRLTIQPTNYAKISLADSYDQVEDNTLMVGIQFSIYDLFNAARRNAPVDETDLQQYLFMPLERQFATIGSGKSIPVVTSDKPEDVGNGLERRNVWFFSGKNNTLTADADGGTYETPFDSLSQEAVDKIYNYTNANGYSGAYLYFNNKAPYTAYTAINAIYAPIMFRPNQILEGRMDGDKGFLKPATGAARPVLIGQVQLATNDQFNNLQLQNDSALTNFGTGVLVDGATGVSINGSLIGTTNTNTGYSKGIYESNNSSLTLSGSGVYAYEASANTVTPFFGIDVESNSRLTLGDGNVVAAIIAAFNTDAYGIYVDTSEVIISGNGNTVSAVGRRDGYGFEMLGNSEVIISGNGNTVSAVGRRDGYGFEMLGNSEVILSGNGNMISGIVNGDNKYACGYGFIMNSDSKVIISGNGNAVFGDGDYGTGFEMLDNSEVIISGNGNTVSGIGNNAGYGFNMISFNMIDIAPKVSIIGSGNTVSGNGDNDGYGFYLEGDSKVTISGNGNKVFGAGSFGHGFEMAGNSEVTLSGNGNAVFGGGNYGYGFLMSDGSEVILSGNGNTVSGIGNVYGEGFEMEDTSKVTLSGNGNTISGTGDYGYGFYLMEESVLDIKDSATNTKISVNGHIDSWGIFAEGNAEGNESLKLNGTVIGSGTAYDPYVTYDLQGNAGMGNALEWGEIIKEWNSIE